jgi:hypothetical protein
MENLIKEDILRIKDLINGQLNESTYYECERFNDNKQKHLVCKKIASLKSWIHKDDGLGLKKIIDKKIESLKSDIPDELKQKYINGTKLLNSAGKITNSDLQGFIKKMETRKLVYLNGEWQPINKLNTNYKDLAELITDLVYKGGEKSKPIIQTIIRDPKKGLQFLKKHLNGLIDKYFQDPNVLLDYTRNIQKTSAFGESAEKRVKEVLEEKGFKTEYEGGNGDLVDMVYGVDLVVSHPKYGIKTIQIKDKEKSWDRNESYKYVDWIIIASPFTIYDNKTKKPTEI